MDAVEELPPEFLSALSKLHWSAGGEWSASIRPEECRAILHQLGVKSTLTKAFAKDVVRNKRTGEEIIIKPAYLSGDPDDEHDPTR